MIFRNAADRAGFLPHGMAKTDLGRATHLFAGLNAFEPGQSHEPHVHCDRDKLYVVLRGEGELIIGGTSETVRAGDVGLAPAGVEHALSNRGRERLVVLVVMAPAPPERSA